MNKSNIIFFSIAALCINDAMAIPQLLDKIIAVVDTSIVLESDINTLFSAEKNRQILVSNYRRKISNRLIIENIIFQLAERAKITIKLDLSAATQKNYINSDQLRSNRLLIYEGIDYKSYYEKIRKERLFAEVLNFLVHSSFIILQQEIDALAKHIFTKKSNNNIEYNCSFIKLPANSANTQKKLEKADALIKLIMQQSTKYEDFNSISIMNSTNMQVLKANHIGWSKPEKLPTLFAEHLQQAQKDSIIGPIYSQIGFYILKVNDRRTISSSDQLIIFDEVYARHIMLRRPSVIINNEKACVTLMDIAQQIKNGHTSFSDAAKQLSEDQYSANHGGDLGWNETPLFDPALRDALIHLKKGEIGTPVHSSYGWHLIQLIDTRKIERTETEKKKNSYRLLFNRKLAEATLTWIKEQRTSTYITYLKDKKKY